jgi:DNA-directed RNA polymerase specialized sigma24 family protein
MNNDTEIHHPATHVHVSSARTRDEDVDALMELATGDDREALGKIARRFRSKLLREARDCLRGDRDQADDVVQDFFLSILEGDRVFVRGKTPATAWMRAIVRAMARDRRGNRTE